jgi:hypothetical protein
VAATAFSGYNFDVTSAAVHFLTSNASANGTLNFRASSSVTLNTFMATGQVITCVLLITNGSTPYYPVFVTVDGSSVTTRWQGGTAPTAGNANSIDSYTFSIIKTAASTYTVIGSQTRFA